MCSRADLVKAAPNAGGSADVESEILLADGAQEALDAEPGYRKNRGRPDLNLRTK